MALWFFRGLRRGVLTTRYPQGRDAWAAGLPSPPAFRPELLTDHLVDELIAVCPSQAVSRDPDTLLVDYGACTGCGQCLPVAGAAARSSGEWELTARSRAALIKRVPIRGES